MLLNQVALVLDTDQIQFADVTNVCAALQKQATRDFGPVWSVEATVDPFQSLEDVPIGYWPVILRNDINTPGAAGVHKDNNAQPFALVQVKDDTWPITASHEMLEMLADPWGSRLVAGPSLKDGQGRVEFLVEVADPCEDAGFGYTVNGVLVSDFYTPNYFDPVRSAGVRYDFTGAITAPRQVLRNGYLSWRDPVTREWFQMTKFGAEVIRSLGVFDMPSKSLREMVDERTPAEIQISRSAATRCSVLEAASATKQPISESKSVKARDWRTQIDAILERDDGSAGRPDKPPQEPPKPRGRR